MSIKRTLVTAALPYANGSIHLGHLVEYTQADIYVRALNAMGHPALFICGNDAHGTPIELNAAKQNITPEALVAKVRHEQLRDFAAFDVAFDNFGSTHSNSNKEIVERAFATLKEGGFISEREQEGNFCPKDKRFLPDRFIRGTCPKCASTDQYGDVCEKCGATYAPTDLKAPSCALCGTTPERRLSKHLFFTLSRPQDAQFLRQWIDSGTLQADVANYVRGWIDGGLKDWNISRDGPYFGFAIPGYPGKFFYVWLDAPFGYVASSAEWAAKNGCTLDELWRSDKTRIEHIIGKDIMYFHTLFWPAVLQATGYSLPSKVHVHGMLTVNGEKMSKSRGTFIPAKTFAEHVEPQALRYYFATKFSPESRDIDLSFEDLVTRVNAELVNKMANLFSRVGQFVSTRLDNRLGQLPFSYDEAHQLAPQDQSDSMVPQQQQSSLAASATQPAQLAKQVVILLKRAMQAYSARDLAQAVRELNLIADVGNELMQVHKPWDLIKKDPESARTVCTFVVNICHALVMGLWPVVPRLAQAAGELFCVPANKMDPLALFTLQNRPLGKYSRLMDRLDPNKLEAMVEASREPSEPKKPNQDKAMVKSQAISSDVIDIETFRQIDLRVAKVLLCEAVPKSKKLLRFELDLGEDKPRQVLSGIAQHVSPETMLGKRVVVVANLAPVKLMGLQSHGMILSCEALDGHLKVLLPDDSLPGGAIVG